MKSLLITTFLIVIALCSIRAQQTQLFDDRPKITVNGEAVVKVQPDQIIITFGIETWDKNIQTDYLSIEPRYGDNYEKRNFIGYFVRNTFVVTLAEPDKVENLVTGVLQSGVNYIHSINFQTTEFKKYREQARELALNAAKEKAEKMAGSLGQLIGNPIQISEGYGGANWYYSSWNGWGYGSRSNYMSQNVMQNIEGGTGEISETIALGKISIKANVNVVFELKK
jgi:uncharacterized protein YggE